VEVTFLCGGGGGCCIGIGLDRCECDSDSREWQTIHYNNDDDDDDGNHHCLNFRRLPCTIDIIVIVVDLVVGLSEMSP